MILKNKKIFLSYNFDRYSTQNYFWLEIRKKNLKKMGGPKTKTRSFLSNRIILIKKKSEKWSNSSDYYFLKFSFHFLDFSFKLGLVDRFFFGTGLLNQFRFRTGLSEPVSFSNRFIQTGFYLGNQFNKKNINKRSKIKVKFEVFLAKLIPKLFL